MHAKLRQETVPDLFGLSQDALFGRLLKALQELAEEIVRAWDLPQRSVIVNPNYGKEGKSNEGRIVSYSISVNEPAYPATKEELSDEKRTRNPCVTFKASGTKARQGFIEITLRTAVLERIKLPQGAVSLPLSKTNIENDCKDVAIPMDAPDVPDFFKSVVELKLKLYKSAFASPFGCCSQHEECSDAKRCIHPNRLYSTACAYRNNLESGRIFYGKNRNI